MESENILIQLILISFSCLGWSILISKGMILEKLGDKIESLRGEGKGKFSKWIAKPLGACVPCSSSIVGLTAYLLLNHVPYGFVVVLLVSAVALNYLLQNMIEYSSQLTEDMEFKLVPRRNQAEIIEKMKSQNNIECKKGCGDGKENTDNTSDVATTAIIDNDNK